MARDDGVSVGAVLFQRQVEGAPASSLVGAGDDLQPALLPLHTNPSDLTATPRCSTRPHAQQHHSTRPHAQQHQTTCTATPEHQTTCTETPQHAAAPDHTHSNTTARCSTRPHAQQHHSTLQHQTTCTATILMHHSLVPPPPPLGCRYPSADWSKH